ncbi:transcriptional regulator [Caldivirga maquilingensis]|uniref:TRASH domain protein n=1 Tax=Caldivirga maquilingensis (strain ATCC 700844 / DSM 13496 / JCM 10307 / IC-167) TaxID=397948 RepID=A8M9B0_CALMQ|nr:transcriptional regulator [Caldivirga maquilingensis]ABW02329.1 TRASH domain protein [Caldivirga maquilingensis IC-167]
MRLRNNTSTQGGLRCENCGMPITLERAYVRVINGERHYFCCEHCANAFEQRHGGV